MGRPTASNPRCELSSAHNIIPRVSCPWPTRTKDALRVSMDEGTFEDVRVMALSGSGPTKHPVHFTRVVDKAVGSAISQRKLSNYHVGEPVMDRYLPVCHSELPHQYDAETYLLTWVTNTHVRFLAPHID